MNLNTFTLIVPTKNEASNIGCFLDSVPQGISIIFVDASSDNTRDVIQSSGRTYIRIIRDDGNIASARQLAAECAQSEWLLYSDADVCFSDDYFESLQSVHLNGRHGAVVGAKLSRGRYSRYYQLFSKWLWLCCAVGWPVGSGSNMLVRRRAVMEVGGFDRSLNCNEDSELIWRIHRHGYKIEYNDRLKVYEFDHRRLDRGLMQKTAHSIIRCALLLCGFHRAVCKNDWGYWRSRTAERG